MRRLVVEQHDGARWVLVAELDAFDPPMSITSHASGHREIIRFRWEGAKAIIDRSLAGEDWEEGSVDEVMHVRRIVSTGWETLATLDPGEEYRTAVLTPAMTRVAQVRWRHIGR
jgi:hypothetical protein